METREFALPQVLTVTTGRLLCDLDGCYKILSYILGFSVMTHEIPLALGVARPTVIALHPQLEGVEPPEGADATHLTLWLGEQEQQYGITLPIAGPAGKRED